MRLCPYAAACLLVLLAACSTQPPERAGLPDRDGAPPERLDATAIADAVPRFERITARGNTSPYTVNGRSYEVMTEFAGFTQRGVASWYGTKFHGRPTATGEIYSLYEMTAAHRTLPLPVYVQVTNLDNGRTAVVKVNDRGPFHSDRIIDLSYAAAVKLGFAQQGTAPVEIQVIDTDNSRLTRAAAPQDRYFIQVGAFSSADSAARLQARLVAVVSHPVLVTQSEGEPVYHRVRVGPFADYLEARRVQRVVSDSLQSDVRIVSDQRIENRTAQETDE